MNLQSFESILPGRLCEATEENRIKMDEAARLYHAYFGKLERKAWEENELTFEERQDVATRARTYRDEMISFKEDTNLFRPVVEIATDLATYIPILATTAVSQSILSATIAGIITIVTRYALYSSTKKNTAFICEEIKDLERKLST